MNIKKLSDCKLGKSYLIKELKIQNKSLLDHLRELYIKENTKITLLHRSYGNKVFMIKALDVNYALDKNICDKVIVYDE